MCNYRINNYQYNIIILFTWNFIDFDINCHYIFEKSPREILIFSSDAISSPRNFEFYNGDLASRYKETQCTPRNMTDNIFLSRSAVLHACERIQLAPRKNYDRNRMFATLRACVRHSRDKRNYSYVRIYYSWSNFHKSRKIHKSLSKKEIKII